MTAAATRARRVLHCALALHVLDFSEIIPEDAAGNPEAILADLSSSGALGDEISLALDRLVQNKVAAGLQHKTSPLSRWELLPNTRAVAALSGRSASGTRDRRDTRTPRTALRHPGQLPSTRGGVQFSVEPDDLLLLDQGGRCVIQSAAFVGTVLRQGVLDRQQIRDATRAAREAGSRVEDHIVEVGLLDPMLAMDVFAEIQRPRPLCSQCLQQLDPSITKCPNCSQLVGDGVLATKPAVPASEGDVSGVLTEGRGIFGGYELIERVAEGGMGVVFRARDRRLHRIVALKVMRGGSLASTRRRQRFVQEAEAVAALHHPNVVPIHQTGEIGGYPFYTMDFVEGETLDRYAIEGKCSPSRIAALLQEISEGVHHFHLRGLIHRDLKPPNILVTKDGVPKIIDFGIAKKLTSSKSESWTVEGDQLGTPHYMPPEQAGGRIQEIDVRSDVYALGAILYQLLASVTPFHEVPERKLTAAILDTDPIRLRRHNPKVEIDLQAIVEKAMARERGNRYQSSLELAQDLGRYLHFEPVLARRATLVYSARKFVRRRRRQVLVAATVLALLSSLAILLLYQGNARQREARGLIARARTAPLVERPNLLSQALGIDPENAVATLELQAAQREIAARRQGAEELRLAEERRRREAVQRRADRLEEQQRLARANAAVRAAEERDRAQAEARAQAQREAEGRARVLLARARATTDPLEAIGSLSDGLILAQRDSPLHAELEREALEAGFQLARRGLEAQQAGLAEYWLRETRKLSLAAKHEPALRDLEQRIEALLSGRHLHRSARRLIAERKWRSAREQLGRARRQGVSAAALRSDEEFVASMCLEQAQRLLSDARALLRDGKPTRALDRARRAATHLELDQREPAENLVSLCADAVVSRARIRAFQLFRRVEDRAQALGVLEEAARTVVGTDALALVQAELRHRSLLLRQEGFEGLVYLPAVPALGVEPCFIMANEVTALKFAAFLEATGGQEPLGSLEDSTGGRRPARGIGYAQAKAYADWLSAGTKRRWRLPTRKEWEVACGWDPLSARLRSYPWGDRYEAGAVECDADSPRLVQTSPRDRSPLGVFDGAGNVAEWVECDGKAGLKGAPFSSDAAMSACLASVQLTGSPTRRPPPELLAGIGFRLVLEAPGD